MKLLNLIISKFTYMFLLIMCFSLLLEMPLSAQSAPPVRIEYQGVLREATGNPVTGPVDMVFTFYDALVDGTIIWQEAHTSGTPPQVSVASGLFTVILGDPTHKIGTAPAPDLGYVFGNNDEVYLGISVEGDNEMIPRIRVTANAFSLNAGALDGIDATLFSLNNHTHPLTEGATDITASADELNRLDGAGPTTTAPNLTSLTNTSNADVFHAHDVTVMAGDTYLRKNAEDVAAGRITFTGEPTGNTALDAGLVINPASAAADSTLLGVSVAGSPRLVIDAEGDTTVYRRLAFGGNGTPLTNTALSAAATISVTNAVGSDIMAINSNDSGTVHGIIGEVSAPITSNTVNSTGIESQAQGTGTSTGNCYGVKVNLGTSPSFISRYGAYGEATGSSADNWGLYTPGDAYASTVEVNGFMTIGKSSPDYYSLQVYSNAYELANLGFSEKLMNYFYHSENPTDGDGQAALYAYKGNLFSVPGGSYYTPNSAVHGYVDIDEHCQYGFAVCGHINSLSRSGGVFGGNTSASYWGALGYRSSSGNNYGGYFTSYAVGGGKSWVKRGVGFGSYGGGTAGWFRGDRYGAYLSGDTFGTYANGDVFVSGFLSFPQTVEQDREFTFGQTSTSVDVIAHGSSAVRIGKSTIFFADRLRKQISTDQDIVVICTPRNRAVEIVLESVTADGFTVNSSDNSEFSWIVLGRKYGYDNVTIPDELTRGDFETMMASLAQDENSISSATASRSMPGKLGDEDETLSPTIEVGSKEIPTRQEFGGNYHAVGETVRVGDVIVIDPLTTDQRISCYRDNDPAVVGIVIEKPGPSIGGFDSYSGKPGSVVEQLYAPIAVSGSVVQCKVDAEYGPVRIGDLLTTSPTAGHAQRAEHPQTDSIVGKALEPLDQGQALINVQVMM